MDEPKKTGSNSADIDNNVVEEKPADIPKNGKAQNSSQTNDVAKTDPEENLSQQEKLRRAKIAMEGFERTIKRETYEKEERASKEKQKINKILDKVNHDKELLELTWVNLDDKRSALKKILEPLIKNEEKLESEEINLESQEDVTFSPRERREIEQKRWNIQSERRKAEEEKWVVEERILKIEDQIEDNKKKYQTLLTEEDKLRKQLKDIDEQIILQEEVLRQQQELKEATLRQEALKKAEEERRRQENINTKLAEKNKADEEKLAIEKERLQAEELRAKTLREQSEKQKHFEEMRKAEEERQKQETVKRQEAIIELKKKIEEATQAARQASISPISPSTESSPSIVKPKSQPLETIQSVSEQIATEEKRSQNLKEL
ncbi:MAG: hypothetical protein WC893_00890 [Candidatus Paceibacterota bacterium]|jgi:hypothetical protein